MWRKLPLSLIGWKGFDKEDREKLFETNRCTLVFSHTSYFDALIFLLYVLSEPRLYQLMVASINEREYRRYKRLIEYFCPNRFIPVTSIEKQGNTGERGGSTKTIIKNLQEREMFLFFISPEGTLDAASWKSGYYNISKEVKCEIRTVGLDYEKQRIFIGQSRKVEDYVSLREIEALLQKDMYDVVPYVPTSSFTAVRPHDVKKIAVIPSRIKIGILSTLSVIVGCVSARLSMILNLFCIYLSAYQVHEDNNDDKENSLMICLIILLTHLWTKNYLFLNLLMRTVIGVLSYYRIEDLPLTSAEVVFSLLIGLL